MQGDLTAYSLSRLIVRQAITEEEALDILGEQISDITRIYGDKSLEYDLAMADYLMFCKIMKNWNEHRGRIN